MKFQYTENRVFSPFANGVCAELTLNNDIQESLPVKVALKRLFALKKKKTLKH